MAWLNPLATAAIPASQSGPIVPPGGEAGNILVLDGTGERAADSGVSFGTDPDQVPNCAQVSGMISEELINAPTLPSVAVATTAHLAALSGTQLVDEVAVPVGKLVLVKSQNELSQHQNGVYLTADGAWPRCYYNGSAWVPVTAAQTTYDDLAIDLGIIQVTEGKQNSSMAYRCAVSDTSKLLTDTTVAVIFSKTTLAPVPDLHNRHVSINNGNDTNNSGTPDFPYQRIGRALQGMSFPGVIKVAVSGAAYSEAVAIPAAATALTVETAGDDSRGGGARWIQPWAITYPDAGGFLTLRGITWATGGTNPFSAAGGKAANVTIENCAFSGAMADVTPLPPGEYTGEIELRNVDMTAAPNASIAIRFGAGNYHFCDQQSPVPITMAGGGTGVQATINIHANCDPGAVRVPLNFLGKVNRHHPAPSRLAGVLKSQAQLNTLLANTSAETSGFYLISGFVPAQNAALAGGIIGHLATGAAPINWWERSHADAPGSISDDIGEQTYAKAAAPTYWRSLSSETVAALQCGYFTIASTSGYNFVLNPVAGNITLDSTKILVTLKAGVMYALRAFLPIRATWARYAWFTSAGVQLGTLGYSGSLNAGDTMASCPAFTIFTPTVDTQVRLSLVDFSVWGSATTSAGEISIIEIR